MNFKVGVKLILCNFYSFYFVCIMLKEYFYECEDKICKNKYFCGDILINLLILKIGN